MASNGDAHRTSTTTTKQRQKQQEMTSQGVAERPLRTTNNTTKNNSKWRCTTHLRVLFLHSAHCSVRAAPDRPEHDEVVYSHRPLQVFARLHIALKLRRLQERLPL
jgi:hypothetical protein